ncbi:hypothetical protein Tco_0453350 [Tanacetum coccineum]
MELENERNVDDNFEEFPSLYAESGFECEEDDNGGLEKNEGNKDETGGEMNESDGGGQGSDGNGCETIEIPESTVSPKSAYSNEHTQSDQNCQSNMENIANCWNGKNNERTKSKTSVLRSFANIIGVDSMSRTLEFIATETHKNGNEVVIFMRNLLKKEVINGN